MKLDTVPKRVPLNDFPSVIVTFNDSKYSANLTNNWESYHMLSNNKNEKKLPKICKTMKFTKEKNILSKHQRSRSIRSAKQKDKQNHNSKKSRFLSIHKFDEKRSQTTDSFKNKSHAKYNDQVIHCSTITCYNGGVCNDQQKECICLMGYSGKHCEIGLYITKNIMKRH